MTRAEIHAMESGQAMDAFVAERVMGWTQRNSYAGPHWYAGDVPAGRGCTFEHVSPSGVVTWLGWQPSAKIADAWEVVEALRAQRRDLVLNDGTYQPITYEVQAGYDAHGPWTFCCFALDGGIDARSARAMTAPLAICRAALLTTLSEEEYAEGRRWIDGTKVENGRLVLPT